MSHQAAIISLACAAPALQASQSALREHAQLIDPPADGEQARRVALLYERAGVASRGLASEADAASDAMLHPRARVQEDNVPDALPDGNAKAQAITDALAPLQAGAPHPRGSTTQTRMQAYAPRAFALAHKACTRALASDPAAANTQSIDPRTITHVVTASCTGFGAPGWEVLLPAELGLQPSVRRTHLGFMGCHAAINALRVAQAYVQADAAARVLVCCTEVCSLHFQFQSHDPARVDRAVANALFGDGAAAAVVARVQGGTPLASIASSASMIFENTRDQMSWHIGDHGFEMTLSPQLPHAIRERAGPWLAQWLSSEGLRLADIASWAVHPGGPSILAACEGAMQLPPSGLRASREVLAAHGNMSSPTVLFVLDVLRKKAHAQASLHPTVLLSFGPGVAAEAMLLR